MITPVTPCHGQPLVSPGNLGHLYTSRGIEDPVTKLLIDYATYLADQDTKLWLVSATLERECNKNSNFTIHVVAVTEDKVVETIRNELNKGRVMVFVPTVEGKLARQLVRELKDQRPVLLSRAKFEEGMSGVADIP